MLRYKRTLPVVTGLSILGAAAGVQLGRAAIAEIDPAYFNGPETPFHADLVPYKSPDWAQVQSAEYHQALVGGGMGAVCIGCRDIPLVYSPQSVSVTAAPVQASYAEAAPAVVYEEEVASDPEIELVRRYASYPLTAEEQEGQAAAEAEEEPAVYASTE